MRAGPVLDFCWRCDRRIRIDVSDPRTWLCPNCRGELDVDGDEERDEDEAPRAERP